MGLVVSLPMLIPLWVSWRKSKRRSVSHKTTDNNPKPATAAPQPKPKAEPAEMLEQTLESNRQSVRAAIQQRSGKRPSSYLVPRPVATTGNLRFIYEDSQGNISTREVSNWREKGIYLEGYCHQAHDVRTFRRDRIVEFLEGEDLLYTTERRASQRSDAPDSVRDGDPEITFSGFDAKTRDELEKTAKAHGFIVRKSVTKNLDYFVAGPRRSGSKLEEAEDKPGCSVTDKEGFLWLVTTGEVKVQ